ncbi:GTPase IMAP family member 8-like [Osmerus mordax]|uniref:GTPase IMAP family member 8-like n=1 Tax=Osmerus mordax TaxID=8014 RepID=UPI0035103127
MASGDSLHLSELRIVLLGGRYEGKRSSGNTILGREEFDLRTVAQCVKRQGEVAGRQVTVVNTPGWWRNLPVESTTELVKQETVHSVSLCPPGPHTLLLVIKLGVSFTEEHRRSVEGHLQLLSDIVWSHTIVLFTCGDHLGDTTIEQHIEREGKALQWLVDKCGNRYHVFNNKNRGDGTQITELLDKMEEMVAGNRGGHYEMDRKILDKIEVWRTAKEMRVKQRKAKVMKQREILRSFISESLHLSELRIVLLGGRDAGKRSSRNTILGREEFDSADDQCVKKQGEVAGRQVTVVDTPGWWNNLPVENTTELVKQEILRSVSLCPPGPHTLLLVIRLDVSFTEEEANSVEGHLQLLSERVWSHTIVLFTCEDCLGDTTIEQHIETEGKVLQWLVEKCGNRYHVFNNKNRADDTQVTELLDRVEEMVAANSGDVFQPEMDGGQEMNWSPEEYQTSPLPLKRANSIGINPPSLSGSRAQTDNDSGWRSDAGSDAGLLWSPEKRGGGSSWSDLRSEHARTGFSEKQLRSARLAFVERVKMPVLDDLLDGLLQEGVINDAEMEAVKVEAVKVKAVKMEAVKMEAVRKDRAQVTIDMVLRKGSPSCFVMKTMLGNYDPALYKTLGFK